MIVGLFEDDGGAFAIFREGCLEDQYWLWRETYRVSKEWKVPNAFYPEAEARKLLADAKAERIEA